MKANGRGNGALTLTRRSPPPGHGATGLLTLSTFSRGYERNYQHISSETTPPQNTNTQSVLSRARAHSEEISPRQGYTQPASAKGGRGLSWGAAGGGGWGRGDSGPPAARGWPGQVLAGLRGRRCEFTVSLGESVSSKPFAFPSSWIEEARAKRSTEALLQGSVHDVISATRRAAVRDHERRPR